MQLCVILLLFLTDWTVFLFIMSKPCLCSNVKKKKGTVKLLADTRQLLFLFVTVCMSACTNCCSNSVSQQFVSIFQFLLVISTQPLPLSFPTSSSCCPHPASVVAFMQSKLTLDIHGVTTAPQVCMSRSQLSLFWVFCSHVLFRKRPLKKNLYCCIMHFSSVHTLECLPVIISPSSCLICY